jgi:hypothetical protein
MAMFGGWFGGPRLVLRGRTVDGAKREQAWAVLAMPGEPPTKVARDALEACRHLIAVEHYERALELLPKSVSVDWDLAPLLQLDRERVAPLIALARHSGRRKRRRAPRVRADVVTAVRDLYVRSLSGEAIKPEDLRDALGDWA